MAQQGTTNQQTGSTAARQPAGTDAEPLPHGALCEQCEKRPGSPTETDKRGIILLCSTCFNIRLRRRLSWWRHLAPVAICALMVPALAFFVGNTAEIVDALRSDTAPYTERTLRAVFANGWAQLTSATDHLGMLVAILAIAVALPASLSSTVSTGVRIAERQKATSVPSLDDHVRLARLDRVLGIQTVIAMSTAVLAFIVVADTVTDGGPGWAAVALLGLLLAVLLIVDVDRIGTFGNFAEQTRLMVKAEVARVVWPRRERTLRITGKQASVAIVATSALHSIGLIIACLPQWPQGAFWGLLATVVALPLGLALAGVAYPYLRHGDRPSAVIAVSLGVLLGVLLAALAYQVSFVTNPNSTHLWAVLLGSAWYVPLYALLALGVCGIS